MGVILIWTWDDDKDEKNKRKHKLSLSIGEVALADPLSLTTQDPHPDGDRWDSLCEAYGALFYVVHTWPDDDAPGRIISVRRATKQERRRYEDGDH